MADAAAQSPLIACAQAIDSMEMVIRKQKVRVALVGPSLRYVGGQSVQADLLIRHWQNDSDVEAFFVPIDPPLAPPIKWALKVPYLRTLIREPIYLRNLYRELGRADIVHAFSASYASFLLAPVPALLIGHRLGKKVIINYRSGEAADHLQRSPLAIRLLASAEARVVPSGYLKRVFGGFGLAAEVVPNLVDTSQFSYRVRDPLRPRLICSRGFHPYYRVDLVVRAFKKVKDEYPEATLCLLGNGPVEREIRALVDELKLTGVEFTGPISRGGIGSYYDRADIFINASYVDNMPVSVLEALGAGTPVVSTSPEGIRYIVEDGKTGLLCDPGDWERLGDNVIALLRNPERARRLAQNGLNESARYVWEAIRPQWIELYYSLAGRRMEESIAAGEGSMYRS